MKVFHKCKIYARVASKINGGQPREVEVDITVDLNKVIAYHKALTQDGIVKGTVLYTSTGQFHVNESYSEIEKLINIVK
jgi:hypothetical protein